MSELAIPREGEAVELEVDGRQVRLTNLAKPFWPELGLVKADLLRYYARIAPALLPHVRARPMVMKRYPDGWKGKFFFMKRTPARAPEWVRTHTVDHGNGNVIAFPVVDDLPTLLWLVNLGCIDLNPWPGRAESLERPDYMHLDLDPAPGAAWRTLCEAAEVVRQAMAERGAAAYVKTSGSRGLHLYVPLAPGPDQKQVWRYAKALATELAKARPDLITAEYTKAKRPEGRVLLDYNQNRWTSTLASVYSVRPVEKATVSTPLAWDELGSVEMDQLTLLTVPDRVAERGDLWAPLAPEAGGRFDMMPHLVAPAKKGKKKTITITSTQPGEEEQAPAPEPKKPLWPELSLPLLPPYPPAEAKTVKAIPARGDWQYEPKWDGFRCLAFRDGAAVALQSKGLRPLGRYFPEVVAAVAALPAGRFVLDGELIIEREGAISFEDLQVRLHPAASRVQRLSQEIPAGLIVFDILLDGEALLAGRPLSERRAALEAFAARCFPAAQGVIRLSPATLDRTVAQRWFDSLEGVDGVIAKKLGAPYTPGERTAIHKVKRTRTADVVVAGFRWHETEETAIGSLLLGLYDEQGLLHHVGHCSGLDAKERVSLVEELRPLMDGAGFSGSAPGGPSRWSGEEKPWVPLAPERVIEIGYDHWSGGGFRHGTKLLRWRPDKRPRDCTYEQIPRGKDGALDLLQ